MQTFTRTPAPTYTPWGRPDQVEEIAPGWWSVSTPSHGGFILSDERLACIPAAHLDASFCGNGRRGFFEEDCDWCIPAVAFSGEFAAFNTARGIDAKQYADAADATLAHWIMKKGGAS